MKATFFWALPSICDGELFAPLESVVLRELRGGVKEAPSTESCLGWGSSVLVTVTVVLELLVADPLRSSDVECVLEDSLGETSGGGGEGFGRGVRVDERSSELV